MQSFGNFYSDRGLQTDYFKRGRHLKFSKLWPPCWKMDATLLLLLSQKLFTTRGSCWCQNVHKRVKNFYFKNILSLKINRTRVIAFQSLKCLKILKIVAYIFKSIYIIVFCVLFKVVDFVFGNKTTPPYT